MHTSKALETARPLSREEAEQLLLERSERIDAVVRAAWDRHLAAPFENDLAALAVGGFGRRELFPYSDVDVLILTRPGMESGTIREPLGHFLRELWDSGLRISHSVHTVQDCSLVDENNVELSISLLDRRPLIGNPSLAGEFERALEQFYRVHGAALARMLAKLTRDRHAKFHNSIYHLEPNIKETPGALRDLQVVNWQAKLLRQPAPDLAGAWRLMAPIRCFLHAASRRDDNLLSFEMQDGIAEDPAAMMRGYYREARLVFAAVNDALDTAEQSQPSLIRQFRDWRTRLSNSEFTVSRNRVLLRAPGQFNTDPELPFRLLEFMARHGLPMSAEVERRLAVLARTPAWAGTHPRFWPQLKRILSQPKASFALRAMHNTGLLSALIPEWSNIDCLVVRDFYHRYTVDEHTLVAIEVLENIEEKRFRDLLEETPELALLRFALLLHDAGKASGRDHAVQAAELARSIGARIGVPEAELDTVNQLIARHLELSSIMNSRDLDDVETGRLLAAKVGTIEQLKLLTLLTYADISAVNPAAMTPWRADQLWRAYLLGYEELTSELDSERIHDFEAAGDAVSGFVEGLPNRYLRTHTLEQIVQHAALAGRAEIDGVGVDMVRRNGYWQVVAAARDRPFLFASIAGALSAFGMNILKAEAFANARGTVLDFFTFADPLRTLELNPSEIERLRDTISRVILGKQDVKRLLASRPRTTRASARVEPRIAFNNKASESATLIEIVAQDRPGLLYDLASTMSGAGCDIVVVLIDTEASKALDVFYVTAGGAKLDESKEAALFRDLLSIA